MRRKEPIETCVEQTAGTAAGQLRARGFGRFFPAARFSWGQSAFLLLFLLFTGVMAADDPDGLFFDEQLGEILPGDIVLIDENGVERPLEELIDKPTLLSLVYFECPGICTPLLNEVTDVLGKTDLDPAEQPFQLLTVSFEPSDTPETATRKRDNYFAQLSRPFPKDNWRFMTGNAEDIDRLTAAVGFKYKKVGFEYIHPGGLIILTPKRKVSRYLYGTEFLPFDFKMGVIEASKGKVLPTTARFLEYCFSYDPQGRTYVFNTMKVVGSTMLTTVGLFTGFLVFTNRRRRNEILEMREKKDSESSDEASS